MTVDVDFRQPANGRISTGAGGSQPMTFGFSGDDVWVFIDDVLVLDLGGIHSEIYGTINFETGDVYIGRAFGVNGVPENPADDSIMVTHTTLAQLYAEGRKTDAAQWNGSTFASGTSHTLKMFYLERGNYDSSIALRFNLQPLLYQQIRKVDQNGDPVQGVNFELYPAEAATSADGIQCFYTDDGTGDSSVFYVKRSASPALVTITTDADGYAQFRQPDASFFNFADRGDAYYILREVNAPAGYRKQPIDIVLYYDSSTTMLSVTNRWTTGAYTCSVSNVTGAAGLRYGVFSGDTVAAGSEAVPIADQSGGLTVAVPLMQKKSDGNWLALYGSNLDEFKSVPAGGSDEAAWRSAVLQAALEQAKSGLADWHLNWDGQNSRLTGRLSDLPGLASRYRLYNNSGDMQMVYGIISPSALDALGITGADADARYQALQGYLQTHTPEEVRDALLGGFRLLSVTQFNRDFRSLIYIPNERRELRVLKIDQDGKAVKDAQFGLFSNPACTGTPDASGFTDAEGMLVFSPTGNGTPGQARMVWADSANTQYYLRETQAPGGYRLNDTIIPVVVGVYGIYADAGDDPDNGVSVAADVGRLTQTMRQYAMGGDVDVTLQDITAFMQTQKSGAFQPDGWDDAKLEGTDVVRSMNLHFGLNQFVDYGLHDEDGGEIYYPFFVTNTGFVRARVQQMDREEAGGRYENPNRDANRDNLGSTDLTNLFSLLNMVVVTDKTDGAGTGKLTISKKLAGGGLTGSDYTKRLFLPTRKACGFLHGLMRGDDRFFGAGIAERWGLGVDAVYVYGRWEAPRDGTL